MEKIKNSVIHLLFIYPFGIFLGVSFWLFRLLGIAKVQGWENFPDWQGKVLVVSNHPSLLEPIILVGLFFHQFLLRPFKYAPWNMADKKNFGNTLFYLMRPRLILVERGNKHSEARGLIQAKNALDSGGVMILFPEGGRTSSRPASEESFLEDGRGHRIRRFKPGLSWLAAKTGAIVLPVWVEGTDQVLPNGPKVSYFYFFRFWKRVAINLGRPLRFKDESLDEITRTVEAAVLALADWPGD